MRVVLHLPAHVCITVVKPGLPPSLVKYRSFMAPRGFAQEQVVVDGEQFIGNRDFAVLVGLTTHDAQHAARAVDVAGLEPDNFAGAAARSDTSTTR